MMDERQPVLLVGHGGNVADALASILNQLTGVLGPAGSPSDTDRSVRLRAEADALPQLVAEIVQSAIAAVQDYDATLVDISVDGFRTIEDGFRTWATATISPSPDREPLAVRIVGVPAVTEAAGTWVVAVQIAPE